MGTAFAFSSPAAGSTMIAARLMTRIQRPHCPAADDDMATSPKCTNMPFRKPDLVRAPSVEYPVLVLHEQFDQNSIHRLDDSRERPIRPRRRHGHRRLQHSMIGGTNTDAAPAVVAGDPD